MLTGISSRLDCILMFFELKKQPHLFYSMSTGKAGDVYKMALRSAENIVSSKVPSIICY